MNINYFWQRKQEKIQGEPRDILTDHFKAERKKLRKKLTRQVGSKPRTHDMDDEMYESVDRMLRSEDNSDIEIARQIIFDSNMSNKYLDKLATEHCSIVLYGPYVGSLYSTGISASLQELKTMFSGGNVGIGTTTPANNRLNVGSSSMT